MYDSEEEFYCDGLGKEPSGISVYDILIHEYAIFSLITYEGALIRDLFSNSAPSVRQIQKGEINLYPTISEPGLELRDDLYGVKTNDEYHSWELFKHLTKYYNRYFDVDDINKSRDQLLDAVAMIFPFMEETLQKGTHLYRIRKMGLWICRGFSTLF